MPATRRSRSHASQAVNVAAEEAARFGSSHLTQVMRRDLTKSTRIPAPPLPDADELAAMVQEQDAHERRRHRERDAQAEREYAAYLAGRDGKAQPEYDDGGDEPVAVAADITDDGDADTGTVPVTRNPVRERLEREAAETRQAQQRRTTKPDALAALEREAEVAARAMRDAAPPTTAYRPTHERLVARVDTKTFLASGKDRESQLLTDDTAATADTNLTARACTLADVDRLWDWIRAEPDSGIRFIGRPLTNSQQLHAMMTAIAKGEATRASLARSLYFGDHHAGFVILMPIVMADRMAAVHMYLRAESRGHLPVMLPSLLQLAHDVMPDVKLCVMGMPPSFAKLLAPYGFRMTTVFQQE